MFLACVIGRRGIDNTASSLYPCQKHYLRVYNQLAVMSDINQNHPASPGPEKIEPIAFRSSPPGLGGPSRHPALRWLFFAATALVAMGLALTLWFMFTARQVTITITPSPDKVAVTGGMVTPNLGDRYLLRPGTYTVRAEKACFTPLAESFIVGRDGAQRFAFELRQSPGMVSVRAHEKDKAEKNILAQVLIDGKAVGSAPISQLAVEAGRRQLTVLADRYQPHRRELTIKGCEKQDLQVALTPNWAEVYINAVPGGELIMDDQPMGRTPLEIKPLAGTHRLLIQEEGYKPWEQEISVAAGETLAIEDIHLAPLDGELKITSAPTGATVMIGDRFAGQTPLTVRLTPNQEHVLNFSKAGFTNVQRSVTIGSKEMQTLNVRLTAKKGVIAFHLHPSGAKLYINGEDMGSVPKHLELPALPHQMEFRLEGYYPYKTHITPAPGRVKQLKVSLKPRGTTITPNTTHYKAGNEYPFVLIHPRPFTMGSSRREQGRRSNETLRQVQLTRSFLMGSREVANKEFRAFKGSHDSGAVKSHSLNRDDQPVVQVTWQEAAAFCNWLSDRDKLPAAYVRQDKKLVMATPLTTGYRLPTEAEWEYCARFDGKQATRRYPWGNSFPPGENSGNFGDESAKNLISRYIEGYNDEYVVTAPPAGFPANALGLFDMGGNVAEWCHDVYVISGGSPGKLFVDPTGPPTGELWIIKGSGWRDSSISELRSAYRGYGNSKRDDVGFRVCRYAQ